MISKNENEKNVKQFVNTSLDVLNALSIKNAYSVEDINWSLNVDLQKNWMPESLVSVSHLPVYQVMSLELKRAFNQYNALGVAEMFIFFEETALASSMEQALKVAKTEPLKIALRHFIDEEYKHSECFKRVLRAARPDLYIEKNFKYKFIKISPISRFVTFLLKQFPVVLPSWVWIAIFFEERTLLYSKEYIQEKKNRPTVIDELFYQAHHFHMLDEVRHVKLDEHMIENFYKTFGQGHAQLTAWIVGGFIRRSAYPVRMISSCLERIKAETPDLLPKSLELKILQQLKTLSTVRSFVDLNFSESAAPRTRYLMKNFKEFKNFWQKIIPSFG